MKIYYYDTIHIENYQKEWEKGDCPGHLLYGLSHLPQYGIKCVYSEIPFDPYQNRLKLMLFNTFVLLFRKKNIDLVYAATFRGLELIILLRAFHLYKKPILVWHHTAVVKPENIVRRFLSTIFYKGIDKMFFFSDYLLNASLSTGKVTKKKVKVVHWGADLDFYNRLRENRKITNRFISTGRENRDFLTLIKAFKETNFSCEIYASK